MFRISILAFFIIGALQSSLWARQSVTFNVNMKPQLEDSSFVPGRDQLRLVGNVSPINTARPYFLTDTAPKDSIFSVTINFSSQYRNKSIVYNFEMTANYRTYKENLKRNLLIQFDEVSLDPLYFNAFAW